MSLLAPRRHWIKMPDGDHHQICPWRPDDDVQRTAYWLRFWRWLDDRGMGFELRTVQTLCPCGFSVEECPCALDVPERIAHEVTA